jgi:hypothetical protein
MDLKSALFPHGPADSLDPSSFHDLLFNAESLISRLQEAYKEKCMALADLRGEQAAQIDEMDEADTRARHLRMQLEDLSSRASEQERQLRAEVESERQKRMEMEAHWRRQTMVEERPSRTTWQKSGSNASDSGFESEMDSDGPVSSSVEASPILRPEEDPFIQPTSSRVGVARRQRPVEHGCRTCKAMSVPVGNDMRTENQRLKLRISELEDAVSSCLDLVSFGV